MLTCVDGNNVRHGRKSCQSGANFGIETGILDLLRLHKGKGAWSAKSAPQTCLMLARGGEWATLRDLSHLA